MKIDQLYNGLIEESLSSKVFHVTNARNAYLILKSDKIHLSQSTTSNHELKGSNGRHFYLSTARSKTSTYVVASIPTHFSGSTPMSFKFAVVFHLDGNKLNSNFKARPFDFDHRDRFKGDRVRNMALIGKEKEDRLYSDLNAIGSFSRYITHVDIGYFHDPYTAGDLLEVIKELDSKNIPFTIYKSKKGLIQNNKNEAYTQAEVTNIVRGATPDTDNYIQPEDFNNFSKYNDMVDAVVGLILTANGKSNRMSQSQSKSLKNIFRDWQSEYSDYGAVKVPEIMLSNTNRSKEVQYIIKHMKSGNYRTVSGLVTELVRSMTSNI
ncbi:hypothetical protein [Alishewanella phage vB_AspM_Slickus01]|nr:hypothetical protein [Alishewanella phage vB_AspM_Slickus01]